MVICFNWFTISEIWTEPWILFVFGLFGLFAVFATNVHLLLSRDVVYR